MSLVRKLQNKTRWIPIIFLHYPSMIGDLYLSYKNSISGQSRIQTESERFRVHMVHTYKIIKDFANLCEQALWGAIGVQRANGYFGNTDIQAEGRTVGQTNLAVEVASSLKIFLKMLYVCVYNSDTHTSPFLSFYLFVFIARHFPSPVLLLLTPPPSFFTYPLLSSSV